MNPVNPKTKDKPAMWRKYSFYFDTPTDCNDMAAPIAATLRCKCSHVYFARYTGALESRLDVYFLTAKPMPIRQTLQCKRKQMRWTRIDGPVPCSGSFAHAAGCEAVLVATALMKDMPLQQRREQFIDVVHWMYNMFGIDYVDEARCNLFSIDRILSVFENSIKLGNKITKAQRRASKSARN